MAWGRMMRSAALLLAIAGFLPSTAQAGPSPLPGHSISNPPDINHLAKMWHLSGTTMPSHRSLILTPGVADRVGTIFSKLPLKTNDFSAEFTFSAKPGVAGFEHDGFAFWYTEENASEVVIDATMKHSHNQDELIAGTWYTPYVKQMGLGIFGYRTQYKGVGVFFGRDEVGKSSVSASYGDSGSSFVKAAAPSAAPVSLTCLSEHTSPFIPDISKLETTSMMRSRSHVIRRKGRVLGVTRLGRISTEGSLTGSQVNAENQTMFVASIQVSEGGALPAMNLRVAARRPMLSMHGFASRLGLWGVHECCFWGVCEKLAKAA